MDFDPLSLFTAPPEREDEVNYIEKLQEIKFKQEVIHNQETTKECDETDESDDDSYLQPLHILEFPILQLKPTYEVLITILKLLSLDEIFNFSNSPDSTSTTNTEVINPLSIFEEKNLDIITIDIALEWLSKYCPRFNSYEKLAHLPHLSNSLKKNNTTEYNAYLTRIISNPLSWIHNQDHIHEIHTQASLRISENCGRTAQPEIIRKIVIPNLSKLLNNNEESYIRLKEPSLTSDNLGLKTWGSSLILSNRLINNDDHRKYLHGNVLELGSGTGLVGMICSILKYNTILTDLKEIIPNLKTNLKLNNLDAKAYELDWSNPKSFLDIHGQDKKFDTIVISDPIYSSQHPYWVVDMINQFLSKEPGSRVLIQIPLRPKYEQERQLLWDLLRDNTNLIQREHEIEDGFDDFGEMKFCFKLYSK
ncbi:rrg1 [[Candida] subhashii]|uniref:Rrg1 n=1 Tax=[Candida] subhashii TaxID=561895 RepID=A0A8J5V4S9_9ASCO|nr:rrg1 [[Candida] subhashii]KAG7665329.1 rrg1 [[Candida] subhashii]